MKQGRFNVGDFRSGITSENIRMKWSKNVPESWNKGIWERTRGKSDITKISDFPLVLSHIPLFPDSGTFLDYFILMFSEIIPERKSPTLKRPCLIDWTLLLKAFQKHAFKIVSGKPFLDGQSVLDAIKVFLDAIDWIRPQEGANLKKLLLIHPNMTGYATAAAARTVHTCTGVKGKIKSIPLYDPHRLVPFLLWS